MHITILYPPRQKISTMSRRRKIEIKASELACFDTLVETLRTRPEFADLDPTSLHVWAYENYEPTIRNAARAIRHFDHWLAAHRNEMFLSSYSGNRLFCKRIWPKLWELHARHSTGGLRTAGWKDAPHAHFRMENGAIRQTQSVKHWKN